MRSTGIIFALEGISREPRGKIIVTKGSEVGILYEPRDKLRLDQAFKRLKDRGCVRSRREMVVKLAYFVLLGDIEGLCEVVGQSEFVLEREVEGRL